MFEENGQSPENEPLSNLKCLGDAHRMVPRIFEMIGHSKFFADFTADNVETLAKFMTAYRAEPGEVIIREGDIDDYMLFVIEGRVSIVITDSHGERRPMTVVGPGATLGEMSMIDGEPRFASCIAIDSTVFAVLSRDSMVKIIVEQPSLGAKILIKLVTLLSQRLRSTSSDLLHYMERTDAV
jgi:CRP/FNR family transcriptional regulator, cyclic AMP receptor protein